MKVKEIVDLIDAKVFSSGDMDKEIESVYTGDLLSHVMSKIGKNALWVTIMNNVNVCAVASLSETSVVVLCESVAPDEMLIEKAKKEEINLVNTSLSAYEVIKKFVESGK